MSLFVRADGGRTTGFGHLMRCHALAQEARRRDLSVTFLTRPGDRTGIAKLQALGEMALPLTGPEDSAADLAATLGAMRLAMRGAPLERAVLVTDHNDLDAAWLRGARDAGPVVVSLNDLPRIRYASHLVVNGNLGAEKLDYDLEPGTRLLPGPPYFFFRDEFLEPGAARAAQPEEARRVVVALGAGDPRNVTQAVLEALEAIPATLQVTLVVGGAYGHLESLEGAAARSRHTVRIERDLARTAPVFAEAEVAVCAGGATAYEMAILGVPAVVLILSETQRDAALALAAEGIAVCAGPEVPREAGADKLLSKGVEAVPGALEALRRDAGRRRAMAERGRALFDGLGRARVLDASAGIAEARDGAARG